MIFNYFKIAFRYLVKTRIFSVINIFGLTVGFLCFLTIVLYVNDELNFDMFHTDAAQTYRVLQHELQENGSARDVAPIAARIGPEALKQLPEIEDALRISALGRLTMGNDPANRNYEQIVVADSNFFQFFDFKLLHGDPNTALSKPDAVVLTEAMATKYFGKEPALGKHVWTNRREFIVTGIMQNFPKNSHLQFDVLFSEATWVTYFNWYTKFVNSDWSSNTFVTYLKIKKASDAPALEKKLSAIVKANYPVDKEFKSTFSLLPMKSIHLHSDSIQGNEINANGMKPFYIYMFAGIAILVLLIACLNYMNLSTAAAYKRTREIGTRKTLGALKGQLLGQFSGEAIVLSAVSLSLALCLLQALLPFINAFTGKDLMLSTLSGKLLFIALGVMLMAGLLSSLYPAYIISNIKPADAIKKQIKLGSRSLPVRKMLIVVQFSISIMMIASTLVIHRQLTFMRSKELGFNRENLVVIDINSNRLRRNFEGVKAEFSSVPGVQSISASTRVPGEWKSFPIATVNKSGSSTGSEMIYVGIDQDFLDTYRIKLLEGRNFVSGKTDSTKVILTRLAAEQLGLTNPIGQIIEIPTIRWGGSIEPLEKPFRVEVIGIADNFHFESFRQKMMPLVFAAPNTVIQGIDYYTARIKTDNWTETISKLKQVNSKLDTDNPLEYTYLDQRFEEFYQSDIKRGQIFLIFSGVIVVIACLGLFALVAFSIENRTKEIGIRKVMGASVQSIVSLVSKEFLGLVLIAGVISIPVTCYVMKNWLQDFAYHITMSVELFAGAALIALMIAFVTISFRSIKAAITNPVDSLRNE
jgi:putative ABC transport system permease protein